MNKIKCIYAIKDKRNDKVVYIGQTKDFKQRKQQHFSNKKRNISKYMLENGKDNFDMIIIEEFSENISIDEMRNKEQEYIEKYNTIEDGFNERRSGNKKSQEQFRREYVKEYNREYKKSEKYKEYRKSEKYKEIHRESNRKWTLKKKQESQDK